MTTYSAFINVPSAQPYSPQQPKECSFYVVILTIHENYIYNFSLLFCSLLNHYHAIMFFPHPMLNNHAISWYAQRHA
jgi:hypothetical protein